MTIDTERLEKAKDWARHMASCCHDTVNLTALADAAEQVLATPPRYKEVERVAWEVLDHDGVCHGIFGTEEAAHRMSMYADDRFFVRLTGTAKVRA